MDYTTNGLPIFSHRHVEERRQLFAEKKTHDYIAQVGGQENALHVDADIIISGGNRGGGKANTYDTEIITPNGTVTMGELKVGDPISTPYEGTKEVKAIFEQGEQEVYHFHFDDGTNVSVMDEHRFLARKEGDTVWNEVTAGEIIKHYIVGMEYPYSTKKDKAPLYELPMSGEIKMHEEETEFTLPLHPYFAGCVMSRGFIRAGGDGFMAGGYSPDARRRVMELGFYWNYDGGRNYLFGCTVEQRMSFIGGNINEINPNYRIPKRYKTASVSARWELLRGILDVSGRIFKGKPVLSSLNRDYIEDVAFVARSLGIKCRIKASYESDYTDVTFTAPNGADLFCAKDKKEKCGINGVPAKHYTTQGILTKRITHIVKVREKQPCRCIQVAGNDHLYLSDAFTVNHNTVMLLMSPMYDINNPSFNGIILRNEKDDLANIIRESEYMYGRKGEYSRSTALMRWDFRTGSQIKFSYYSGAIDDFKNRFQGRQYSFIGVDEITQMEWEKFKYLITCNRNGAHIRNRFLGTCNPDPSSWVAKFIDWWIGEDGYAIPERDGVIRYCFMGGDTPEEIVWGSSRLEVYEKIKSQIDDIVSDKDTDSPENTYVKSVVFVRAELDDNRALLDSSPEYKANLAQQSIEQRERDFKGNWKFMSVGDDLVKMYHMERCFSNPAIYGDGTRRASCDVAFTGGDACVMWLIIGNHVQDIFVCRLDSKSTVTAIRTKLEEWRVLEENFVYDLQGVGQAIKGFFPKAKPFNNQEAVDSRYKGMYDTKKSQCLKMLADQFIEGEISFEPSILTRVFSGKNFKGKTLREILMEERKVLKQDMSKQDRGWCNIPKDRMKSIIHRSPDFIESLAMKKIFDIKASVGTIPSWVKRRAGAGGLRVRKFG